MKNNLVKEIIKEYNNKIVFKNVSFSYGNNLKQLKNVNLTLEQGKINLIIGENGSGKTTLMNLVLKIWDNYEGDILINESNIKDFKREDLLEFISYTFQKNPIFKDSILNNILLNRANDEKKIESLLKEFNFYEDIYKKEDNIKTLIDDYNKLSGGQIQKIGIMRTLYSGKKIMIFDEPTSSLDEKSKIKFIEIIKKFKKKNLIVIISHDKSFVDISDFIFEK
jgi:ABC-type multidrug transport system fused ATPase/permease subunit